MFGLNPDTLRNIKQAFAETPVIDKVILYGSRAKGNYRNGSDIDITLLGKNLTLDNSVYTLMDKLEELYLPYTFDISIFSHIDNENLIEHINRAGKVLYLKEKGLPEGWEVRKLGDVCEMYQPKTISKKQMITNGEYPVFGANGIIGRFNKYNHKEPQLLITCRGATCGSVNISEPKSWINGNAMVVKPIDNSLNIKFIEYLFLGGINISEIITGAAQPQITRQKLSPVQIPLPSLPEQKRIVAILDKAFTAINKVKANTEQNLKNARELFQSKLQETFDNGKLKIENGEWEEKTLGEVVHKTETVNPELNPNKEFIYLDVSSVNKETKQIEKTSLLLGKDAPSRARKLVRENDVIFATVRPTHSRVAIIPAEYDNQVCSTGYYVLRAKEFIDNHFIYYFLLTIKFNQEMEKLQKGASYPAVTNKEVESRKIIYPKQLTEQRHIIKSLGYISAETQKLETIYQQKINDLDELKKSILQKAFSGEL